MHARLKLVAEKLQRRSLGAGRIHQDMSLQELWSIGLTQRARDSIVAQMPHFTISGDAVVLALELSAGEFLGSVDAAQRNVDDRYSKLTMLSRKLHQVSLNEVEWFLLALRFALAQGVSPERLDEVLRESGSFDRDMPVVSL